MQPSDTQRGGASRLITRRFSPDGSSSECEASPRQRLAPSTLWRIARQVRAAEPPRVLRTLEDTPFYARTLIEMADGRGQRVPAVHETLDVPRLVSPIVQAMLPFRMPRRA